ncbi:hypothetical protein [Streptomyces hyaluromycini]|uniref:hypothetical protein n=1 Tax=Streptomyces hyaluromycini TaxID=1377993 RepID=UPI00142DECFA|nr:hypothetical protein [Streptomyces hyaluromycini]
MTVLVAAAIVHVQAAWGLFFRVRSEQSPDVTAYPVEAAGRRVRGVHPGLAYRP